MSTSGSTISIYLLPSDIKFLLSIDLYLVASLSPINPILTPSSSNVWYGLNNSLFDSVKFDLDNNNNRVEILYVSPY